MSLTLTPDELREITGKVQAAAQFRHLRRMGIRAERRNDGSVCVLRAWLAANDETSAQSHPRLKSDKQKAA